MSVLVSKRCQGTFLGLGLLMQDRPHRGCRGCPYCSARLGMVSAILTPLRCGWRLFERLVAGPGQTLENGCPDSVAVQMTTCQIQEPFLALSGLLLWV